MGTCRGTWFIVLGSILILSVFAAGCSSGPSDAERIESVIDREREILSAGNLDLIDVIWHSDGVIYHGNFTASPQDDYPIYTGLSDIRGFYVSALSESVFLEYHERIDELTIYGDTALCITSTFITMQHNNTGVREYLSFPGRPIALFREGGSWKITAITFYTE